MTPLAFHAQSGSILECEHCYLLATQLSVFTVFHVSLTADAI